MLINLAYQHQLKLRDHFSIPKTFFLILFDKYQLFRNYHTKITAIRKIQRNWKLYTKRKLNDKYATPSIFSFALYPEENAPSCICSMLRLNDVNCTLITNTNYKMSWYW
jgi:hypothetical protein